VKRSRVSGYSRLALLLPMAAVAVLVGVAPFFAALRGSFLHDYFGEISPAGLDNYRYILGDKAFGYSLNISVLWAFLQTLLTVSIALLVAYRLWMRRFGGRRRSIFRRITGRPDLRHQRRKFPLLHLAVLVPWGVPVYIAVPVWRALIHGDGEPFNLLLQPVSGFCAALGVSVWLSLPATIFLFLSGFKK